MQLLIFSDQAFSTPPLSGNVRMTEDLDLFRISHLISHAYDQFIQIQIILFCTSQAIEDTGMELRHASALCRRLESECCSRCLGVFTSADDHGADLTTCLQGSDANAIHIREDYQDDILVSGKESQLSGEGSDA